MMKKILVIYLLLRITSVQSQIKYSISGYVKDSLSSENLIGATVGFNGQQKGVNSNGYGFYSITLPEGRYLITASYVGYSTKYIEVDLDRNINFNFLIRPRSSNIEEVVVYAKKKDGNVTNAQMGKMDLSMAQIIAGLHYAFPHAMRTRMRGYPGLRALHEAVFARPNIRRYVNSGRRLAFNEEGIFRHYPELDR